MVSLLHRNTFGIDKGCKALYEPETLEELLDILPQLRNEPLLIIGGGSNLLLTKDFEGNVLHPRMKGISIYEHEDIVLMRCEAGEVWDDVVAYAVEHGYYDMENLSLIPGEVGASAVQNIGAYGMEAKDLIYKIEAVEIATDEMVVIDSLDCNYAYRYSRFKDEWKGRYVITAVTYVLGKEFVPRLDYGNLRQVLQDKGIDNPTAADVREAVIEIRETKLPDPDVEGNAGSFFMNPVVSEEKFRELQAQYPGIPHYDAENGVKVPAGWMIDQCGWKGKSMGNAGVHDKQALVLVNRGGATGEEVLALAQKICEDVKQRFGVEIHPEVNII